MTDDTTKAQYLKALETVKKHKPDSNYMTVEFGNQLTLLLPHAEGLQLLASLDKAEVYERGWSSSPSKIKPFNTNTIDVHMMGAARVRLARMSQLMNIPLDDLENQLEQQDITL